MCRHILVSNMRRTLAILAAALTLTSCNGQQEGFINSLLSAIFAEQTTEEPVDIPSENPESAASGLMELPAIKSTDLILNYTGYVSSYNTTTLIPDWVAYELLPSEMSGEADRNDHVFSMDTKLKKPQAMREDYRDSGWSKGHMAPAHDFSWSDEAMGDTFLFVNCCPQNEYLNGKDWEYLERQVRRWAEDYGRAWVVTGPIIGENKYGTIGDRHVVVPDSFFKAVMVKNKGKYHTIAFIMDNDSTRQYLSDCALTVNELEDLTGIDFFPNLDDSIEDSVEGQKNFSFWGISSR